MRPGMTSNRCSSNSSPRGIRSRAALGRATGTSWSRCLSSITLSWTTRTTHESWRWEWRSKWHKKSRFSERDCRSKLRLTNKGRSCPMKKLTQMRAPTGKRALLRTNRGTHLLCTLGRYHKRFSKKSKKNDRRMKKAESSFCLIASRAWKASPKDSGSFSKSTLF